VDVGDCRADRGRRDLEAVAVGSVEEPAELSGRGAVPEAEGTSAAAGVGLALLLAGRELVGAFGVLDGAGGEAEGELPSKGQLAEQGRVVGHGDLVAVRVRPSCGLDEV